MLSLFAATMFHLTCDAGADDAPWLPDGTASLVIDGCRASYYQSHDLDAFNSDVRRAVIAVHGVERSASLQFDTVVAAARTAGVENETVVIAPHFPAVGRTTEDLGWAGGAYSEGGMGHCRGDGKVSSFTVADRLVEKLGDRAKFPNLRDLVMIGHSGGGQYLARYAAGTRLPDQIPGLRFKFVPTNPSAWLYFNADRYVEGKGWVNGESELSRCNGYDSFRYGLKHRSRISYMAELSDAELVSHWINRQVIYFIGGADTCNSNLDASCDDHSLDTSCAAMAQGPNRYVRAQRYFEFVWRYFPPRASHQLVSVPGIGHTSQIYASPEGRKILFE